MRLLCLSLLAVALLAQDLSELAQKAQTLLDSDPAQAAGIYQQILKNRPDWAEGWLYLGAALYATNQDQQAIEALKHGVQLAPKQGPAWGFMGLSEYRLNHPDAALSDIGRGESLGLGINHGFESAVRQTAALILVDKSRFDEALAQLQPLANYQDDSPGVVTAAGLAALALPRKPAELDAGQQQMVGLAGQGQWNAIRREPAKAEAAYQELLRRFPRGRGVHYAYGLFLMESDQKAALDQFHLATEAHPDLWPAWIVSATLETKNGNPEAALADLGKARQLAPSNYGWLCDAETGRADLALGRMDGAIAELKAAVVAQPAYAQLHHLLAQAYRRNGNAAEAAKQEAEFERLTERTDPAVLPR